MQKNDLINRPHYLYSKDLQKMKELPERKLFINEADEYVGSERGDTMNSEDRRLAVFAQKELNKKSYNVNNDESEQIQATFANIAEMSANGITKQKDIIKEIIRKGRSACISKHNASTLEAFLKDMMQYGTENQKSIIKLLKKTRLGIDIYDRAYSNANLVINSICNAFEYDKSDVMFVKDYGENIICDPATSTELRLKLAKFLIENGAWNRYPKLHAAIIQNNYPDVMAVAALNLDNPHTSVISDVVGNTTSLNRSLRSIIAEDAKGIIHQGIDEPIEKKICQLAKKITDIPEYDNKYLLTFDHKVPAYEFFLKTIAEKGEKSENREIASKALDNGENINIFKKIFNGKNKEKCEIYRNALDAIYSKFTYAPIDPELTQSTYVETYFDPSSIPEHPERIFPPVFRHGICVGYCDVDFTGGGYGGIHEEDIDGRRHSWFIRYPLSADIRDKMSDPEALIYPPKLYLGYLDIAALEKVYEIQKKESKKYAEYLATLPPPGARDAPLGFC